MSDVNIGIFEGRLTRDPVSREVGTNETLVANFSIATNRSYRDASGEWQSVPAYIDCAAWQHVARRVVQLKQGDAVVLMGDLRMETWDDKETGKERRKLALNVTMVARAILLPKSENGGTTGQREIKEEDIPF